MSSPAAPDVAALLARGIDRSSPVPLYHQLAERLRAAIADGTLPPGSRLENEVALAGKLGLSRPTMRQALQELVDKGLLVRRRGVGTQVVHPHVNRSMALTSLHDDLARSGRVPTTEVLDYALAPAPRELAEALAIAAGVEVVTVRRLRSADGEPLALMINHIPASTAPTREQLETEGLYEAMRARGMQFRVARQTVGARLATAAEARLLHERPRAALVTMHRTAYDDAGSVIEVGDHIYRASRYAFETTLVDR
ncbi:transcriptional regulator, GntR family [Quadrisphaera granulorum]|uniref:GntR family transcriptional regulator n=1 Tax=Quadrisphaera granulorum TaxID=317664 RepID=A0A316AD49_9ACTN|nr:GntR family transcriptional regulator [Quadrisphaera granulorum]PWJ55685.1 GntR family transcriptional regulator [Quadrisphaera granulorum]SZE95182.1 transcriptional regulator, GntR family [Quadrisphaera granulorum]